MSNRRAEVGRRMVVHPPSNASSSQSSSRQSSGCSDEDVELNEYRSVSEWAYAERQGLAWVLSCAFLGGLVGLGIGTGHLTGCHGRPSPWRERLGAKIRRTYVYDAVVLRYTPLSGVLNMIRETKRRQYRLDQTHRARRSHKTHHADHLDQLEDVEDVMYLDEIRFGGTHGADEEDLLVDPGQGGFYENRHNDLDAHGDDMDDDTLFDADSASPPTMSASAAVGLISPDRSSPRAYQALRDMVLHAPPVPYYRDYQDLHHRRQRKHQILKEKRAKHKSTKTKLPPLTRKGGYVHPSLGFMVPAPCGATRGLGMLQPVSHATSNHQEPNLLLRVPLSVQMTPRLAIETLEALLPPPDARSHLLPLRELSDATLLVLLLAHERGLGVHSRFFPYIATLPYQPTCGYSPVLRPSALDAIASMATQLGMDVNGWTTELAKSYEYSEMISGALARDYGPYIAVPRGVRVQSLFQWALCMVASRAIAGKGVEWDLYPEEEEQEDHDQHQARGHHDSDDHDNYNDDEYMDLDEEESSFSTQNKHNPHASSTRTHPGTAESNANQNHRHERGRGAGASPSSSLRLIPLVDMINHEISGAPFLELDGNERMDHGAFLDASFDDRGSFVVRSMRYDRPLALMQGQELLVNYNVPGYSALDWFINMGFVPPERSGRWTKVDNVLPRAR